MKVTRYRIPKYKGTWKWKYRRHMTKEERKELRRQTKLAFKQKKVIDKAKSKVQITRSNVNYLEKKLRKARYKEQCAKRALKETKIIIAKISKQTYTTLKDRQALAAAKSRLGKQKNKVKCASDLVAKIDRESIAAIRDYKEAMRVLKREKRILRQTGGADVLKYLEKEARRKKKHDAALAAKHKKAKRRSKKRGKKKKKAKKLKPVPRFKLKVVYQGVDNSIAAQQARKQALEAVEETIQDNAANGSIKEKHIRDGWKAHAKVDQVREDFYKHQEKLSYKRLIEPKHRFGG